MVKKALLNGRGGGKELALTENQRERESVCVCVLKVRGNLKYGRYFAVFYFRANICRCGSLYALGQQHHAKKHDYGIAEILFQ